jgi:hypothetical protein
MVWQSDDASLRVEVSQYVLRRNNDDAKRRQRCQQCSERTAKK